MGLTIHFEIQASLAVNPAEVLESLRQKALDLPVAEVAPQVRHFQGRQADYENAAEEDRWALIQARRHVACNSHGRPVSIDSPDFAAYIEVKPKDAYIFSLWPGEGCEMLNLGLARYPQRVVVAGKTYSTGAQGWQFEAFCKTQYASNVSTAHFLRCHLLVIAMLDELASLPGFKVKVLDEGEFWEKRDLETLTGSLGEYNALVAGLHQAVQEAGLKGISPITEHPDYPGVAFAHRYADALRSITGIKPLLDALGQVDSPEDLEPER